MKKILRATTAATALPAVFTIQPVEPVGPNSSTIVPEFIRLPKPGTLEPFTGLSRSKLNELVLPSEANGHQPPVRSVSLRKRGQIRGVRLIVLDSLISYLHSQTEEGSTRHSS